MNASPPEGGPDPRRSIHRRGITRATSMTDPSRTDILPKEALPVRRGSYQRVSTHRASSMSLTPHASVTDVTTGFPGRPRVGGPATARSHKPEGLAPVQAPPTRRLSRKGRTSSIPRDLSLLDLGIPLNLGLGSATASSPIKPSMEKYSPLKGLGDEPLRREVPTIREEAINQVITTTLIMTLFK